MMAVKQVVIERMSIARVAANLGVAWNTASDAYRIPQTWPWAGAIAAVFATIAAIPQPA